MRDTTIYHNPRCTKSRETLKLLQDRGERPTVVEYLSSPPSAVELERILKMLGKSPREILRGKESREAGIDADKLSHLLAELPNDASLLSSGRKKQVGQIKR